MPDVTVLGAGGATVTIALTSAQNAAAAQTAVNVINDLTAKGLVDMQIQAGAGSLPGPSNFLAGAVFTGTGSSGASGDQYLFFGANGTGDNVVLGGQNFKTVVVAGNGSDLTFANQAQDAQIWFGKNNSNFANYQGTATVTTEDGNYLVVSDNGTKTDVNLGAGATISVADDAGEYGEVNVNAQGAATVVAFGASTVPLHVNLNTGDALVALFDSGTALINPGGAHATVVGDATGNGSATLFGGTGSVFVADGIGMFTGGSEDKNQPDGFRNVMFSSTVNGSATLVGGGATLVGADPNAPIDVLIAQGAGQTLTAGIGNASLYALKDAGATGGGKFNIGAGFSTVFGYDLGGNTFTFFGLGASEVDGHNEADAGTQATNLYVDGGASGGNYIIADFVSGLDQLIMFASKDYTIDFQAAVEGDPLSIETTTLSITGGATYTFFDTTADGVQDIKDSDVFKL